MSFPKLLLVMPRHIKAGKRSDALACPIALALKEKFPNTKPTANNMHLVVRNGETKYFKATYAVRQFMRRFDADRWVRPTLFLLWPSTF